MIPGRQRIGVLWTILVGIAAAFVGTGIAAAFDVADTEGVDWIEWLIQIGLAALGVATLDRFRARRHRLVTATGGHAAALRAVAKSDLTGRARLREAALELSAEQGFEAGLSADSRSAQAAGGRAGVVMPARPAV